MFVCVLKRVFGVFCCLFLVCVACSVFYRLKMLFDVELILIIILKV